jgi:hypothetical protein
VTFREPCTGLSRAHAGDDLFLAAPDALVRLDPQTGAVRWRRRMRGYGALWPVPGGVVRGVTGGIARISDGGTLSFKAQVPGGRSPAAVVHAGGVLACGGRAGIHAFDAADGRNLWKRRSRLLALAAAADRFVALSAPSGRETQLLALDPRDGRVLWERPLRSGADGQLALWTDAALVLSDETDPRLTAALLADGTTRFSTVLPFGGKARLCIDDSDERALIATGPGGAAARLDDQGKPGWMLDPLGDLPAIPAALQRGVTLIARDGAMLCDVADGTVLARLSAVPPSAAALATDMTAALLQGGSLVVHRMAMHLSLV